MPLGGLIRKEVVGAIDKLCTVCFECIMQKILISRNSKSGREDLKDAEKK
jgi:hypothetical protein